MTYSPSYIDDGSQLQFTDSWDGTFEYAPTPGNFGRSPASSQYSSPLIQRSNEDSLQPVGQLHFIPLAAWKKEKKYVKQPPICVHYLIQWKVTLNGRPVHKVTERNVVVRPSEFWEHTLKNKIEKVRLRRVFQSRRVRLDEITLAVSVLQHRSQNVHQQSESTEIDWTDIEEQLLEWGNLIEKGKQLKLDISVDYIADDTGREPPRTGDKRGTSSTTNKMLSDRDARIDAEINSAQPTAWRDVYKKMRCPGSCKNKDWYCWLDPNGKKHYPLESYHLKRMARLVEDGLLDLDGHDDVPSEIREQLYAKEQSKRCEKESKASESSAVESTGHAINIHFLPSQSPQSSILTTPAGSPSLLPQPTSVLNDPIIFPDLPLEIAVEKYSSWQKSRVVSQRYKDDIDKARDIALENGLDLKQIDGDQDPEFFIKLGVKIGVARRFVHEIRKWVDEQVLDD